VGSPQYDLFSNLPPFLRECEGFTGIQNDLKTMIAQGKPLNSDNKYPLPDLEHVYCLECFTWIQRYYQDIPYLQARINHVLARNRDLERENLDLRADLQNNPPRANKRSKKSGDIIIKHSTNVNDVMNSEMHDSSFSNV
jgi:regulator of replication initiation timing